MVWPGVPPHNPCPAITVGGPVIRCLLRPYTSGGHSLKNQIHCSWPNCPHSLTVPRRTHSSSEGAHPQAGEQACQILNHSPPPAVVRNERCPGSDQNVMLLVFSLLRPSLLVNFHPFLSSGCSRTPEKYSGNVCRYHVFL